MPEYSGSNGAWTLFEQRGTPTRTKRDRPSAIHRFVEPVEETVWTATRRGDSTGLLFAGPWDTRGKLESEMAEIDARMAKRLAS
jgi:hypothetical protein